MPVAHHMCCTGHILLHIHLSSPSCVVAYNVTMMMIIVMMMIVKACEVGAVRSSSSFLVVMQGDNQDKQ